MEQLARGSLQVKNLLLFLGSNRWKNKDSSYLECTAKHRQALLQTEPDLCQASCNQAGKVPKILNPLTKPTGIREEKFDSWFPFSPSFLSEEREIRKYASKCGLGVISLNYEVFLCMHAQFSRFSPIRLLATAWTAAHLQAPLSMGFSRQE